MNKNIFFYTLLFTFIFSISAAAQKNTKKKKGSIITLSPANYKKETAKGLIIVDFWADWCGPCRKLSPILKDIATETNVKIGKLNVDNYKNFATQIGITTLPTMIIYMNGVEKRRLVGLYSKEELLEIIQH